MSTDLQQSSETEFKVILANSGDRAAIMQFIDQHWRKDHILAVNHKVFDHYYSDHHGLNFAVAKNKQQEIWAVLGFIFYNERQKGDLSLSFWKARASSDPYLGTRLLKLIESEFQPKTISSLGINQKVVPIYRFLGYQVGKMNHYYILNNDVTDFKIAKIYARAQAKKQIFNGSWAKLDQSSAPGHITEIVKHNQFSPLKSADYYCKRYLKHPSYTYQILAFGKECATTLAFYRVEYLEKACALRLVEVLGRLDDLELLAGASARLLTEVGGEYLDFYNFGIAPELLASTGFQLRGDHDQNIIPNYFSPFEQRNVELYYCHYPEGSFYAFKGDSDQERPS